MTSPSEETQQARVRPRGEFYGLALCAGIGGLELGCRLAVRGYAVVGACERDTSAASALVASQAATGDSFPVWDDVGTFDGRRWRGAVDLLTAGVPCQPFSKAGARKGTADERWLWDDVERVLRDVGPGFFFMENVERFVQHGLGPVLGSLAELGFTAEWDVFSASGVGAPQDRRRLFLLAWDSRLPDGGLPLMGDSDGSGLEGWREPFNERRDQWAFGPAGGEVASFLWPAPPHDRIAWLEWLRVGGALPYEPDVRRGSQWAPGWADEVRSIGNAVVPLEAAYALRTLATRAGVAE